MASRSATSSSSSRTQTIPRSRASPGSTTKRKGATGTNTAESGKKKARYGDLSTINRESARGKKRCPRGMACPYRDENQHLGEYFHDAGEGGGNAPAFRGGGRRLSNPTSSSTTAVKTSNPRVVRDAFLSRLEGRTDRSSSPTSKSPSKKSSSKSSSKAAASSSSPRSASRKNEVIELLEDEEDDDNQ